MSYENVKEFEYRGFSCEIARIIPDEPEKTDFHEFCILDFVKPTTLDKILFFAIGEGIRSDAVAALIDYIGLTSFYPGDFNKDVELVMKIGLIRHEDHIACYTTVYEDEDGVIKDHWKYMSPADMETHLKYDIDNYHEARKRLIAAMKMYRSLSERMQEVMQQVESGQLELPKA